MNCFVALLYKREVSESWSQKALAFRASPIAKETVKVFDFGVKTHEF
jgi:hypothetical protein